MQIEYPEYNDIISANDLESGDLAEIVGGDPDTEGALVQMFEDELIILGEDDCYRHSYETIMVRRIAGVHAVKHEAPEIVNWRDMEVGQFGVVVDSGDINLGVDPIVQRCPNDLRIIKSTVLEPGDFLCWAGYKVKTFPPGTKITL